MKVPAKILLSLLAGSVCFGQPQIISTVDQFAGQGHFREAARLIEHALSGTSSEHRQSLLFELDRLERIRKDYPLTEIELFVRLRGAVQGVTWREYQGWIREGRFDTQWIEGIRFFMVSSVSNLFFRHPELNPRRMPPRDRSSHSQAVLTSCQTITAAAASAANPFVLPKKFGIQMTVSVKPGVVPPGRTIRAWLPIPRHYPFQDSFRLLASSVPPKHVDDPESPIRSVYLEQTAIEDQPTIFSIEYEYQARAVRFALQPGKVNVCDPEDPRLKPFISEGPHVAFTAGMRELAGRIAGQESNPLVRARKYYEWIAENIRYSFATEYSTIRNLGEYCRTNGYGDCGQEALLFITLCRLSGIPARWQSGWSIFPGAQTIHDWAEIYLEPAGWIAVDPYMGIYAMQYAESLTPDQRRQVRDFYFGGLDQFRMIANSDHSRHLYPARNAMRSDDVDFQRGELEWDGHNVYFDQFSYDLSVDVLSP